MLLQYFDFTEASHFWMVLMAHLNMGARGASDLGKIATRLIFGPLVDYSATVPRPPVLLYIYRFKFHILFHRSAFLPAKLGLSIFLYLL